MTTSRAALALAFLASTLSAQTPRTKPVTQAEVDKITRDAILIDTHDDVPSKTVMAMTCHAEQARADRSAADEGFS